MPDSKARNPRFHGRIAREDACDEPGCPERGEFRAPLAPGNFDGPGAWRWLCLDHVRAFNTRYNFFDGMSAEEIVEAQTPYSGWERETRAFSASPDRPPRWADFSDPLDAIQARFAATRPQERRDGKSLTGEDRRALKELGLEVDATRHDLRSRYSERVRAFHPDRNGGDRSHEAALQRTIAAYGQLKGSAAFA
ncbi:MAG: molecular chaperone DnaJ [Sphingomonadaceae bacterium]